MFSDTKTSAVFYQKVRYSITRQEDTAEWEKKKVYIYNYINDGMDGFQLEEGDQQLHSPPADNKSPASAKLCKTMLWILMLGVIITLAIYFPLEIKRLKKSNSHLQIKLLDMAANNTQLEAKLLDMAANNTQLEAKLLDMAANNTQLEAKLLGKWCPDGWTRFGCSCYCKFEETKSWYDSRKHCQDRGADLVIINSPDEQEFVKKLNKNGESWIGLQRIRIETTLTYEWRWVDGSAVTKTFWATGWPWDTSYETHATCCNDEGKWRHHYYNPKNWICEK